MKNKGADISIKKNWDLGILYKSPKDSQIEKDVEEFEKLHRNFAEKYSKNDSYLKNPLMLLQALKDWEDLILRSKSGRPVLYFSLNRDINATDHFGEGRLNSFIERLTKSTSQTIFFGTKISKIPLKTQNKLLADKRLSKYKYLLEKSFAIGKHTLTSAEEKIISLKSQPARNLWIQGGDKLISGLSVKHGGKETSMSEALSIYSNLKTKHRRALWTEIVSVLKNNSHFAESEINALLSDKRIEDNLRKYNSPYDRTILEYENKPETIKNLTETISDNFSISQKFFTLKKKLMGEKILTYADRSVSIRKMKKKYSFDKSAEILKKAYGKLDKHYTNILNTYIKNGQIDVFPKKGKTSGAYCAGSIGNPTFVLLNHADDLRSVSTFGHEMGHAFHTEMSKSQPVIYQEYSTVTAETASTFFESFVFDEILETLSPKEKILLKHDRLNDFINTIFRQIACFNFETELHDLSSKKGFLPKEEMALLMNKHMKSYLGKDVHLTEDDGFMFVIWSHIRRFFYVYSYALGCLVSRKCYRMVKENPKNMEKVEEFLKKGGSDNYENLALAIGIDIQSPDFFKNELAILKKEIEMLEKEAKKYGLI